MLNAPVSLNLTKKAYHSRLPEVREQLVQLQVELKTAPFKVLLILAGVEGAGRGDLINTLNGWLDPRGVETFALRRATDEERERPLMWRYWRSLPQRGRIGIYAGSWYTQTLEQEADSRKSLAELDHELERIRHFEKLLADDGTLIIKVWLHLSKRAQRQRLHDLAQNEDTAWRVRPEHWKHHKIYARLAQRAENILRATDRAGAPWKIIDAENQRGRDIAVAELLINRFRDHASRHAKVLSAKSAPPERVKPLRPSGLKRLTSLPLDHDLSTDEYEDKREKWLGKLNLAVRTAHEAKRSIVFVRMRDTCIWETPTLAAISA